MRIRRRRRRRHDVPTACGDLLAGNAADRLEAQRRPVPPWAWVNVLAHGTEDEIRCAAVGQLTSTGWRRSRAVAAAAVIDLIDSGGWSLRPLQHQVLIPFELRTMRSPEQYENDPDALFRALLWVLDIQASDRARR